MRKGSTYYKSRIKVWNVKDCESLEEFLKRAIAGNEPIQASVKVTYNDRKDGVLPQHDIRQDRFEIAMLATDTIHRSEAAKRKSADFPQQLKAAQEIAKSGEVTGEA